MRILSADWVVPVGGEPIRDGAVAIAEDGTIAAVGPSADVGAGERFERCVIVPGFVDCHSHLEYAVYAGFGDGLPFSSWIGMHVRRKGLLDLGTGPTGDAALMVLSTDTPVPSAVIDELRARDGIVDAQAMEL